MSGYDFSYWTSEEFDWSAVSDNIPNFVLLKAGDEQFADAQRFNVEAGFYCICDSETGAGARAEAEACLRLIEGNQSDLPIFYIVDNPVLFACGKDRTSEVIYDFCETIKKAGYRAGFQISAQNLHDYVHDVIRRAYSKWIVLSSEDPIGYGIDDYDIWQRTDNPDFSTNQIYIGITRADEEAHEHDKETEITDTENLDEETLEVLRADGKGDDEE